MLLKLLIAAVTLRNCGDGTATITGMGFSPESPAPGDATELWVAYKLNSPIMGGTATYSYTVNGIPFSPTVDDLCTQTECPKAVGDYNETSQSEFPSFSGKVVTKIQWVDQNNAPVWCAELTFKS